MTVLDAHAHLWTRASTPQPWIDPGSMAAIDRDFGVADLGEAQQAAGIDGALLVQSSNDLRETRDLLALVDGAAVRGVVGWVDLEGDVAQQLEELGGGAGEVPAGLVGIRHLAHQDPDPQWLGRPAVGRGLDALGDLGLPFDLVVLPAQLPLAAEVARAHPGTRFVLDHLGKPPLASGDLAAWRSDLAALGRLDNVVAKLSGLAIEGDWAGWTVDDLREPVEAALAAFGPSRLMFGSDWPLVRLTRGLDAWLEALRTLLGDLSGDERAAVFAGTAERTYLGGPHA
ncbi:amidohydrolase family protein [Leifsonia sp. F6_8S_P_1B]|uniref:Amidohydrolase family protein n=1 Tax=Leifsonia williamsii TaxID=3035919 RepID=A0ABT8K8X5_9MICO|nr:amidohydrolase family protein [Leifsonia williamsii]MDN4613914.1 amidohydrolase family protein [Leifsonia williamsii]